MIIYMDKMIILENINKVEFNTWRQKMMLEECFL